MTPRADSPAASRRRIGYPTASSSVTSHGKGARDSRHSLKNARNGCCHAWEHSKDAGECCNDARNCSYPCGEGVQERGDIVEPLVLSIERCGGIVLHDHQGSVAAGGLNADGTTYVKESFTAFGERRNQCTWSGPSTHGTKDKIAAVTRHGYTWHAALFPKAELESRAAANNI
jgi:hypothetical protein